MRSQTRSISVPALLLFLCCCHCHPGVRPLQTSGLPVRATTAAASGFPFPGGVLEKAAFDIRRFRSITHRLHVPELKVHIPVWLLLRMEEWMKDSLGMEQLVHVVRFFPGMERIPAEVQLLSEEILRSLLSYTTADGELDLSCGLCSAAMRVAVHYVNAGKPFKALVKHATFFCVFFRLLRREACSMVIQDQGRILFDLVKHHDHQQQQDIVSKLCSNVLNQDCASGKISSGSEWEVALPERPPPSIPEGAFQGSSPKGKGFKVLHLTDVHLDFEYVEGSLAKCKDFSCCHAPAPLLGLPITQRAGKFGHYNFCDLPVHVFEDLLQHVQRTHKDISAVYCTGDMPSHDIWNINPSSTRRAVNTTYQLIRKYLPGVPIYSSVGNHDTSPTNSFPLREVNPDAEQFKWLYPFLAEVYGQDLDEPARQSIRRGAFYSFLVRPGLRIIAINNNICYVYNWFSYYSIPDPYGLLEWLVGQLAEAELRGEKVHILGHIPNGHECQNTWSHQFRRVVSRFQSTIAAQFGGHTHFDEFQIFYDEHNTTQPVGLTFQSPSITPYNDLNPGYRIFHVDGAEDSRASAYTIGNFETWIAPLEEANRQGFLRWTKLYDARDAYQLRSATATEMDIFLRRMVSDASLFQMYFRHWSKNTTSPTLSHCSETCRADLLCFIVVSDASNNELCQQISRNILRT